MDSSILDLLKPIADAVGVSMVWINATAINVLFGTSIVKQAFNVKGNYNMVTAGAIALAMGFANYAALPVTAIVGSALVFASTALTFKLAGKLGNGIKPRGSADRGPETRG